MDAIQCLPGCTQEMMKTVINNDCTIINYFGAAVCSVKGKYSSFGYNSLVSLHIKRIVEEKYAVMVVSSSPTRTKIRWLGLNIFIDIQTSKTLIQMDINKMMRMEFIQ